MAVALGQQYHVGERPTVILYTYINRHAGTDTRQDKDKILHDKPGLQFVTLVLG